MKPARPGDCAYYRFYPENVRSRFGCYRLSSQAVMQKIALKQMTGYRRHMNIIPLASCTVCSRGFVEVGDNLDFITVVGNKHTFPDAAVACQHPPLSKSYQCLLPRVIIEQMD